MRPSQVALLAGLLAACPGEDFRDAPAAPLAAGKTARAETARGAVAGSVGGEAVAVEELDRALRGRMIALEQRVAQERFELRRARFEEVVEERLLAREARRRGVTPERLLEDEVAWRAPAPADEEVLRLHERVGARLGLSLDASRERLRGLIASRRRAEARREYLAQLRAAAEVELALAPPEAPRLDVPLDGPTRGAPGAPVTLSVFSSFGCSACAATERAVEALASAEPSAVRVVFLDRPFRNDAGAWRAAEVARCADQQGAFWPLHDRLLGARADALGANELRAHLAAAGGDTARLDGCLASGRARAALRRDVAAAEEAGVDEAPVLLVNGRVHLGAHDAKELRAAVARELARRGDDRIAGR